MKRLIQEPLLHFIILGVALFVGYSVLQRDGAGDASPKDVRLTLDDLAQLTIVFESRWRRLPNADEFKALLEERVREDILYREALALGLDKDDTIVRRRMAQKMKFLAEDMAAAREPTPEELRSWLAKNGEVFAVPARVSFGHLYFSTDQRREQAQDDAAKVLTELAGEPQSTKLAAPLSDPFMFKDYYADRAQAEIAREFGSDFAQAIVKLTPGSWQGPVKSGFGWHLVFVSSVVPGRVPAFEEIESDVKTAWLAERKEEAWRKTYDELRAKYRIFLPVAPDSAPAAASGVGRLPGALVRNSGMSN